MKRLARASVLAAVLAASFSAHAHHPTIDIVADWIYAMIDANVADTPHADLELSSMGR